MTVEQKRIDRIRKLLGFRTDIELGAYLGAKQPQISRWRNTGFHATTSKLLDELLKIITQKQKEINRLKREIKAIKDADSS